MVEFSQIRLVNTVCNPTQQAAVAHPRKSLIMRDFGLGRSCIKSEAPVQPNLVRCQRSPTETRSNMTSTEELRLRHGKAELHQAPPHPIRGPYPSITQDDSNLLSSLLVTARRVSTALYRLRVCNWRFLYRLRVCDWRVCRRAWLSQVRASWTPSCAFSIRYVVCARTW